MKIRNLRLMAEATEPPAASSASSSTTETPPSEIHDLAGNVVDTSGGDTGGNDTGDDLTVGSDAASTEKWLLDMENASTEDGEALGQPAVPATETPAQSVTTAPAVVTPATPAVTAPATPATPAAGVTTTPVTPAAPATPVTPPVDTAETVEQRRLAAEQAVQQHEERLAQYYALPEDLAAQLQTEPELALPKLAAKMHMAVINEAMARLNLMLPQSLESYNQVQRAETQAKDAFYQRWPTLKNYEEQVLQMGRMFRQTNPNALPEEALDRVGKMVHMALGLPLPAEAGHTPSATPVTPPAAPRAGFRPATVGAGGTAAPAAVSTNPYEQLAEDFKAEADG